MNFHLLNVFAKEDINSGNQLAVVFPENQLSTEEMQLIAKNFNFSETIFIYDNYHLRIFTPMSELPFAGHPTLGAGWQIGQLTKKKNFSVEVPYGVLGIETSDSSATLTFPGEPKLSHYSGDLNQVLKHCSVEKSQVHTDLVKLVNVGPEFLVIPLKTKSALDRATSPLSLKEAVKCYFIFQEGPESFHVRMFAPSLSVNEDAATGSAACALGGFCREVLKMKSGKVTITQGVQMNRPSELFIKWSSDSIQLSGRVVHWGEGRL